MARGKRVAQTREIRYNDTSVVSDFFNGVQQTGKREKPSAFKRKVGKFSLISARGAREKRKNKYASFVKGAVSLAAGALAVVLGANNFFPYFTNAKKSDDKDPSKKIPTEESTTQDLMPEHVTWSSTYNKFGLAQVSDDPIDLVSPLEIDESLVSLGFPDIAMVGNISDSLADTDGDLLEPGEDDIIEPLELESEESEPSSESEEVDLSTLSTEEKVDFLMNKYNLSLDELQGMLQVVENNLVSSSAPKEPITVSQPSSSNLTPLDFSGYYHYDGSDEALMQAYGFSEEQWVKFCKIMITESEPYDAYVETFATATVPINRLVCRNGYGTNLYDIVTAEDQFVVYQEGTYLEVDDIYSEQYANHMQAIRDVLYNFALDQSKRIHNELEFRAHGTGKYSIYFTEKGNEYGYALRSSRVEIVYIDTSLLLGIARVLE